ncbi:MAG: magnesium/cobalt transporter CorA, partial [Candidatus Hydrogenedentes bacterium]|nr:magnesium/cobalt transporter CorA [Candidatus Hydrogenedentota bacterium]
MALRIPRPRKRRPDHMVGAPPGTLKTHPNSVNPVLGLIAYGPDDYREIVNPDLDLIPHLQKKWPVLWVNVDGLGDEEVLRKLGQLFDIHRLALEDVLTMNQRAKIEDYENRLFMVTRMLEPNEEAGTEQLSIFLGEGFVVTFQEHPGDCLDSIRKRIREGLGRVRKMGADYLAYSIIDAVVDAYFPYLDEFSEKIELLEEDALYHPTPEITGCIHEAKRNLLVLRRAMSPMREALSMLLQGTGGQMTETTRVYLRDCYDHCIMLLEMIESYGELVGSLLDVYLSSMSNRMNEIMKVLTVIATIFIPLSFLTGLYGMNFNYEVSRWNMPELHMRYGYPVFVIIVVGVAVFQLVLFWRRGWLGSAAGKTSSA